MTAPRVQPQAWPQRRFLAVLGAVCLLQVGLIFWLSDRSPARHPPAAAPAPLLLAPIEWVETLGLSDPTLFAVPHWQSFSGPAWLIASNLSLPVPAGSESVETSPLATRQLRGDLPTLALTNRFGSAELAAILEPDLELAALPEQPLLPTESVLRILGDLRGRRLLNPCELPPWPSAELLTNSIIEVAVQADGSAFSAKLLSKSGSNEADEYALSVSRKVRFQSAPMDLGNESFASAPDLLWAQLVFTWKTLPLTPSNSLPANGTR